MECLMDPDCDNAGEKLWYSPDGDTWSHLPTPIDASDGQLKAIARAGNTLVAVGSHGLVLTSVDGGLTWTQQSIPTFDGSDLKQVTYGGDRFLVCLAGSCSVSKDGLTWSAPFSTTHDDPYMVIAYSEADDIFVGADYNYLYHSTGDVFWNDPPLAYTVQGPGYELNAEALIHEGTRFVMTGDCYTSLEEGGGIWLNYGAVAFSSSVNEPWEVIPIPEALDATLAAIGHSPESGRYVGVGKGGLILYADELPTFHAAETTLGAPITAEVNGNFEAVAYGLGLWVAVGEDGLAYLSTDNGQTWQPASIGPGTTLGEDPESANLHGMVYRP